MSAMTPMLDPEQENVMRLDAGESEGAKLIDTHYYVALRVVTDGEDPTSDLRLVSGDGENEIEGSAPTGLHVDRQLSADGPIYRPVRIFIVPETGDYTLHNEGNSQLWLVDDYANEIQVFTNPVVLAMFGSCCLGLIVGIVAIVFGILTWRNRTQPDSKKVSGIVIDGRVMTTDELYRAQRGDTIDSSNAAPQPSVPDPFLSEQSVSETRPAAPPSSGAESADSEASEDWRGWDEG